MEVGREGERKYRASAQGQAPQDFYLVIFLPSYNRTLEMGSVHVHFTDEAEAQEN